MLTYLNSQNFSNFETSYSFILVVFGVLEIKNFTNIHDQQASVEVFTSSLTIRDSKLSNIEIDRANIKAISSIFSMINVNISSINNPLNINFIFIDLESTFTVENISFESSNSSLFTVLSSSVDFRQINFNTLKNAPQFILIQD